METQSHHTLTQANLLQTPKGIMLSSGMFHDNEYLHIDKIRGNKTCFFQFQVGQIFVENWGKNSHFRHLRNDNSFEVPAY